jgi:hypothetical protein
LDSERALEQLDDAAEAFLRANVVVSLANKTCVRSRPLSVWCAHARTDLCGHGPRLTLPTICEWYATDLGTTKLEVRVETRLPYTTTRSHTGLWV